jgi:hypothetical protein
MPSLLSSRKGHRALAKMSLWLLGAALLSPSHALTLMKRAGPPKKLPEWATDNDRLHQPALGKIAYNRVDSYMFSDC